MDAIKEMAGFRIGQPVIFGNMANPDKTGWIAEIEAKPEGQMVYTLGSGKMERQGLDLVIAWENLTTSDVSEGIARPWAEKAKAYGVEEKTRDDVAGLLTEAKAAEAQRREDAQSEREAKTRAVDAWRDDIRQKIPADAKAVLVAEFVHDESDAMTDYFGSRTSRCVILGFSKHTRDLFPEMRKAAARFEPTQNLAEAPKNAEHREKYSMGGGYYLKEEHRHRDGWRVSKRGFYQTGNDIAACVPFGEWSVPDGQSFITGGAEREARTDGDTSAETCGGFTIEEHTHTKRGFQVWIVSPAERVGRETFGDWLAKAKERGGWYSRKWGSTPAGFAFKDKSEAQAFADELAA